MDEDKIPERTPSQTEESEQHAERASANHPAEAPR
jgi:hypothetical protein